MIRQVLVVSFLLAVAVAAVAGPRWDVSKAGKETLVSGSAFTNHPDSAAGNATTALGSENIYLKIAAQCTTQAIFIGPGRRVAAVLRIDGSNTETDDSVDTKVYYDLSWDGSTWSVEDSLTITDTLLKVDQIDSAVTVLNGMFIRLRPDPITGMRQDTVGVRPTLNGHIIFW